MAAVQVCCLRDLYAGHVVDDCEVGIAAADGLDCLLGLKLKNGDHNVWVSATQVAYGRRHE
jgi:hypothetical protein